jgi:hypothetical protein
VKYYNDIGFASRDGDCISPKAVCRFLPAARALPPAATPVWFGNHPRSRAQDPGQMLHSFVNAGDYNMVQECVVHDAAVMLQHA